MQALPRESLVSIIRQMSSQLSQLRSQLVALEQRNYMLQDRLPEIIRDTIRSAVSALIQPSILQVCMHMHCWKYSLLAFRYRQGWVEMKRMATHWMQKMKRSPLEWRCRRAVILWFPRSGYCLFPPPCHHCHRLPPFIQSPLPLWSFWTRSSVSSLRKHPFLLNDIGEF